MLEVRVLGELELQRDDDPVALPAGRPARSLLALLALERREHARSQVAARLWPDVLDASARTSLRGALAALRKALGPDADRYLVATRERVGLSEAVRTDAAEFDRLVRRRPARGGGGALARRAALRARRRVGAGGPRRVARQGRRGAGGAGATGRGRRRPGRGRRPRPRHGRAGPAGRGGPAHAHPPARGRRRPGGRAGHLQPLRRPPALRARRGALAGHPSAARRAARGRRGPLPRTGWPPAPSPCCSPTSSARPSCSTRSATTRPSGCGGSHFAILRDVALSHAGREVKSLGDGLMVAFASSVDAAGCAVGIQQAVERHNRREPGAPLAVRIGLHVGRADPRRGRLLRHRRSSWPGACATAPRAARS